MNYLVPIDFSDQSKTAADYAASLNNVWPGNVHLLHVMVPIHEEPDYIAVKTMNVKKNTVFEMFACQEQLRRTSGVRTSSEMVTGDFVAAVQRAARESKSNLVVMGMQGVSGLREHLYGSHTRELTASATLPVLAVPADSNFRPFSHIAYLTDYRATDLRNIESLGKIAAKFKGLLSIVSVNAGVNENEVSDFQNRVRTKIPFAAVNFHDVREANSTADGLRQFVNEYSVRLTAVPSSRPEVVNRITGAAFAEEPFDVDTPVLFLP